MPKPLNNKLYSRPFWIGSIATLSILAGVLVAQEAKAEATFCAIADIPYNRAQADLLRKQLQNQVPSSCSFLLHLGDIRRNNGGSCPLTDYTGAADILALSPVPVFILLGDNEWNDCSNPSEGYEFWESTFLYFDTKHWSHSLNVKFQPGREYNFVIALDNSLIFGLQMVKGSVPSQNERETRLLEQFEWVRDTVNAYLTDQNNQGRSSGRIVIAAHVDPDSNHDTFFDPLVDYIAYTLNNSHPVLYLNGDVHDWSYDTDYKGKPSFLRITLEGEGQEAPTIFTINNNGAYQSPEDSFSFLRQENTCTAFTVQGLITFARTIANQTVQYLLAAVGAT
jgi:hypothetical protein